MPGAVCVSDKMVGHVPHHNGHLIPSGDDWSPCSGHDVTGYQTKGSSKFFISGKAAACVTDGGPSTDPCSGSDYVNTHGSSKFYIQGQAIVRIGDSIDLYPGTGTMITGSNKFFIGA